MQCQLSVHPAGGEECSASSAYLPVARFPKGVHPIGDEESVVELALTRLPDHVVDPESRCPGPHQMECRTPQLPDYVR